MTTQDKPVKRKLSLHELAEFLKNVSQAFKINGVSRHENSSLSIHETGFFVMTYLFVWS